MNLNQLWAGNDYAYYSMRGRGETFRPGALRVRIVRAYQKRQYGNERLSGFAEVNYLNDDGTFKVDANGDPRVAEIRARDIAMRWDEYVDERDHREAERERINREHEEQVARETAARDALLEAMVNNYGIPRHAVTSIDGYQIRMSRSVIEQDLGARANDSKST